MNLMVNTMLSLPVVSVRKCGTNDETDAIPNADR